MTPPRVLCVLGLVSVVLAGCFDELRAPGCASDGDCFQGQGCVDRVCVDGAGGDTGLDADTDRPDSRGPDAGDTDVPDQPGVPDGSDVADVPDDDSGCAACVEQVFAGPSAEHACAVSRSGQTWCWGSNFRGQLGDPDRLIQRAAPVRVVGDLGGRLVSSVSAGAEHTCVLTDNAAWCWGDGSSGQFGRAGGASSVPERPASLADAVDVSVGAAFTCFQNRRGDLSCVGLNEHGQLGLSPEQTYSSFMPVAIDVVADGGPISAGRQFACAIRAAGATLQCWGSNEEGQLGRARAETGCVENGPACVSTAPLTVSLDGRSVTAVAAGGDHACAIDSMGETSCWGANDVLQLGRLSPDGIGRVDPDPGFTQISAGYGHTCAVGPAGVYCWGDNLSRQSSGLARDQIQSPELQLRGGQYVSSGRTHTCALREGEDERLHAECWGANDRYQLGVEAPLVSAVPVEVEVGDVRLLDAGTEHTCAVEMSGAVWCWGANDVGQLGDGVPLVRGTPLRLASEHRFAQIAAGNGHTCGVLNRELFCWGVNNVGQLGIGEAPFSPVPMPVPRVTDVAEVVAGSLSACARTQGGDVYCWGDNSCGRLGLSDRFAVFNRPTQVASISGATALAAGPSQTCAIAGGDVYCWGENPDGALGVDAGATGCSNTPVLTMPTVALDVGVDLVSVAVAEGHMCAVDVDGGLYCMGRNSEGQLGVPGAASGGGPVRVSIEPVKQVVVGEIHTCASTAAGAVYCWGFIPDGALGTVPSAFGCEFDDCQPSPVRVDTLAGPAASLAAGRRHTCATTTGGEVFCWGQNAFGQLGDGSFEPQDAPAGVLVR